MKKIILPLLILLFSTDLFAQLQYPASKKVEVSDTYWGVTYKDQYRWLEDMKDPQVNTWFKQQADLTNATMSTISGRDELIAEWRKLDKLQPPNYSSPVKEGGRIFFKKKMPGEKISKVYFRENVNGADQLLFDPLTFIAGKTLSAESIIPSYDGKKLLIGYAENGAEVSTLQVMDVYTKKFLPDVIPATAGAIGWNFDNTAIVYMWIKSTDNTDPNARLNPKNKFHKLCTDVKEDVDFFSNASYPSLGIEAKSYPFAFLSKDAKNYIFGGVGTVQNELTAFYAPIIQYNSGKIQWKTLCSPADKLVRSFDVVGDKMFCITYKDAKNYKLVSTDLKNPDWANAKVIAPEKNMTLETFTRSKDYLLLKYSDGINNHFYKYNLKTEATTEVKLPFSGTAVPTCIDTQTNEFILDMTSWNKPFTEFLYNAETEQFTASPYNKPLTYPQEYTNLAVEEVEVKGHDGVMIPLSIIYKKGLKKDGSNVCLMYSYGAYGISMEPYFSTRLNSLEVKGVIIAIPHVRGGSEKVKVGTERATKPPNPTLGKISSVVPNI